MPWGRQKGRHMSQSECGHGSQQAVAVWEQLVPLGTYTWSIMHGVPVIRDGLVSPFPCSQASALKGIKEIRRLIGPASLLAQDVGLVGALPEYFPLSIAQESRGQIGSSSIQLPFASAWVLRKTRLPEGSIPAPESSGDGEGGL